MSRVRSEIRAVAGAGLDGLEVQVWRWDDLPMTGSYKVRRGVLRKMLASPGSRPSAMTPA